MKSKILRLAVFAALPVVLFVIVFRINAQRPQPLPVESSFGQFLVTPDGRYLVKNTSWIGELKWFDFKTGQLQSQHPAETNNGDIGASTIAVLPNSQIVAGVQYYKSGDISSIALYDLKNPTNFRIIAAGQVGSPALAVSPKTSEIAVLNSQGELCFWNPSNGKLIRKWPSFLGKLRQYEIEAVKKNVPEKLATIKGPPPMVVSYSPDGKTIAIGGWYYVGSAAIDAGVTSDAALWDIKTGRKIRDLPLPNVRSLPSNNSAGGLGWNLANTTSLVFSPNGHWIANDSHSDGVVIWNAATGAIYKLLEHPVNRTGNSINYLFGGGGVAFSADSSYVVAPGNTGMIDVWDVQTGQLVKQLAGAGPVAFVPHSSRLISNGVHGRGNLLSWSIWH